MNLNLENPNNGLSEIEKGDLLITVQGFKILVRDVNEYACMNLEGNIVTNWYRDKEELLKRYKIVKVIKSNDLEIIFNKREI